MAKWQTLEDMDYCSKKKSLIYPRAIGRCCASRSVPLFWTLPSVLDWVKRALFCRKDTHFYHFFIIWQSLVGQVFDLQSFDCNLLIIYFIIHGPRTGVPKWNSSVIKWEQWSPEFWPVAKAVSLWWHKNWSTEAPADWEMTKMTNISFFFSV